MNLENILFLQKTRDDLTVINSTYKSEIRSKLFSCKSVP